jgi:hypothetical protein
VSGERPRWVEVDPWGHRVACAESVWATKAGVRAELALHEGEIRATVHDPDRLYLDWASTTRRAVGGRLSALIVHYVTEGRTRGKWAGNLIDVVVKWLDEGDEVRGYVHTVYLPGQVRPRLQLWWRRPE